MRFLLLFACLSMVSEAFAADSTTSQPLNIPAQSLAGALDALAKQSGLQLLFDRKSLAGKTAPAVRGRYTPIEAARLLLRGSGWMAETTGANAVAIKPLANALNGSTTLPKVKVTATAFVDHTDPFDPAYVIPDTSVGTKTDTPIMETPLNVQVISKQVLKDQQVITLAESLKNVSGVLYRSGGTLNTGLGGQLAQSFFLRGFESETFFRNGFRLQQGSASKGFANVESVEVMKGPAAILYGLVEPGGMVNVVTKQPLATPYYGFTQQFGSYDLFRTTLDATGPLSHSPNLLYRFNGSFESSGSFREFVDKDEVFLAPVLTWKISPQTQITFEMEYNHQHLGLNDAFVPFLNGRFLKVPYSRNYGEPAPATTETFFGGFNWSHQFNDDWTLKHRFSVNQYGLSFPLQLSASGAGTKAFISSIFGDENLNLLNDDLLAIRGAWSERTQRNTYSTNLDLTGHFETMGLKHTLLIGGDYYRLDFSSRAGPSSFSLPSYISLYNPVHPGTPSTPVDYTVETHRTDQYGLYFQDQIALPYDVHIMGGFRYQNIHQFAQFSSEPAIVLTQDAVTPRVGFLWQAQSWLSLYANYVESFGANGSGVGVPVVWPANRPIAPTGATQYEGGIKTEFFDGRLRATLAYYDLTKTNIAVTDPNPFHFCAGGGPGSCSIALGAVRSRGPELDIQGELLPGWNVIANWANTDIVLTKSNSSGDSIFGPGGVLYAQGSRLPNIPRNFGSIWTTYEIQSGDLKGLSFGGGATLRDQQKAATFDADYKVPGTVTLDLMTSYHRKIGDTKISFQLNVNNLLDKRYYSNVTIQSFASSGLVDFGQPRTLMGLVSLQY